MSAVDVHHVVEGPPDAPALVLLNSLGSTLAMWEPQIEELAAHVPRRALRPARPRRARPCRPDRTRSPTSARDVVALLDRLEIERAHLAGVSLGGMTAMWMAHQRP